MDEQRIEDIAWKFWLDTRGVIVLGETQDQQHVQVSLSANIEAQRWLDAIPDAQRESTRRAVVAELAEAGVRIKRLLHETAKDEHNG